MMLWLSVFFNVVILVWVGGLVWVVVFIKGSEDVMIVVLILLMNDCCVIF